MSVKVSVIMLNYNQKYFPRMCVEALKRTKADFEYEIIAVDNASTDDSIKYLRKAANKGEITLIESGANLGYGQGNNLGVRHAKGKYVFIINPDIVVTPDTMQKMVDYLEKHPKVGVLGPKLVYSDGTIQDSCRRHMNFFDLVIKRSPLKKIGMFKKRLETYTMEDFDHDTTQEVDLLCGAAYMFPKKVYDEVGGFDKRYFLFMEDFDICREIAKKGHKVVYFPEVSILHNHKRLSGGSLRKLLFRKIFWIHVSSAIKYFSKWGFKK